MQLVLASSSPARLMVLRAAGIEPRVLPSNVDEDWVAGAFEAEHGPMTTAQHVQLLARAKAEAVLGTLETEAFTGLVFGGDSSLELDGETLGKPHTPERARERWRVQRGKSAVLHSGHYLIRMDEGRVTGAFGDTDSATVHFAADISDADLDAYVATGEPLEVAGAFTIDALGAAFIDRVEGAPSAVIGLSIPKLRRLTTKLGVPFVSLWSV